MGKAVKYAIGEQDFKSLREMNFVYIDKTAFIEKIIDGGKYYFLARPRRFGKSLFLSTLRYFFEGKRELFKGLYIDSADWDWDAYPVLRIDLNTNRFNEQELLESVLNNLFREWEEKYEVDYIDKDLSQRFRNIVKAAHRKTGKQVVILVDEYDKPLVGNLNRTENFDHYRNQLASIYSNCSISDLKGLDLLDPDPRALLYQTGYLTIKDYIAKINRIRLGIPNRETNEGLVKVLIPALVPNMSTTVDPGVYVAKIGSKSVKLLVK